MAVHPLTLILEFVADCVVPLKVAPIAPKVNGPFTTVAELPFPEASATVDPVILPLSNTHSATGPVGTETGTDLPPIGHRARAAPAMATVNKTAIHAERYKLILLYQVAAVDVAVADHQSVG